VTGPDEALGRLERVLGDFPQRLADARSRVAEAAASEVAGADAGGLVRVTATGQGRITAVRVSDRARRDLDPAALAERITEAVNDALARGEGALADAAYERRETDDTAYAMARFEERMDGMLDRLSRLDRDLEDRLND
jgi:DNA-binding protein YbaB